MRTTAASPGRPLSACLLSLTIFTLGLSGATRAEVPQAAGTTGARVGVESFGAPVVEATLALGENTTSSTKAAPTLTPGNSILVRGRFDLQAMGAGAGLGVQKAIALDDDQRFLLIGSLSVVPMVLARPPVVVGLWTRAQALLGYRGDSVVVVAGPRLTPVVSLDRPTDGRVGLDGVVGVGVPLDGLVGAPLTATADLAAGADLAAHGLPTMTGAATLGVQLRL